MSRMWMIAALVGAIHASAGAAAQDGTSAPGKTVLAAASEMSRTAELQVDGTVSANDAAISPVAKARSVALEGESGSGREARMRRALTLLYLTLGSGCKDSVCSVAQSR